jgi:hypothetical protein
MNCTAKYFKVILTPVKIFIKIQNTVVAIF